MNIVLIAPIRPEKLLMCWRKQCYFIARLIINSKYEYHCAKWQMSTFQLSVNPEHNVH